MATTVRVLMLGDVVGQPGVRSVMQLLPALRHRYEPDVVLANGENAANGSGLTPRLYQRLCDAGVEGITLGDHVYRKAQIIPTLEREANVIRPANLPAAAKGRRWMALPLPEARGGGRLFVFLLLGRVFLDVPVDEPFAAADALLGELPEPEPLVLVELHAEATAEKRALAYHLDGRVAAMVGTHTHVPTADAQILAKGSGYITDIGMCGPQESVIGRQADRVVKYMSTAMPAPFDVAEGKPGVSGVVLDLDRDRRRTVQIERFDMAADVSAPPFASE
jgi:hypothetical protein